MSTIRNAVARAFDAQVRHGSNVLAAAISRVLGSV